MQPFAAAHVHSHLSAYVYSFFFFLSSRAPLRRSVGDARVVVYEPVFPRSSAGRDAFRAFRNFTLLICLSFFISGAAGRYHVTSSNPAYRGGDAEQAP